MDRLVERKLFNKNRRVHYSSIFIFLQENSRYIFYNTKNICANYATKKEVNNMETVITVLDNGKLLNLRH